MNQSLAQRDAMDDAVIEQMKSEQYRQMSAMEKIGQLSAHIVCTLVVQRKPVIDVNGRWWTVDDISQKVRDTAEYSRWERMLDMASTKEQIMRAVEGRKLLRARIAKTIADDLAMGFYMNMRAQSHRSDAIN